MVAAILIAKWLSSYVFSTICRRCALGRSLVRHDARSSRIHPAAFGSRGIHPLAKVYRQPLLLSSECYSPPAGSIHSWLSM
jgi:hypothetical protein